jgi:hypothetical protein
MSKPDFLFYKNEETGLGFIWEGGDNIDVLSRAFREGGENRKMPGWFVTFDCIGGMFDGNKNAPTRPYLQDELEAEALEWLADNGHIEREEEEEEEELEPLAQWAVDTGNEIGGEETLIAAELVSGMSEAHKAATLAAGAELWQRAKLDEMQALSLVVAALENNVLTDHDAPDADDFLVKRPVVGAWEDEFDAAKQALDLVCGWSELEHNPNGDVPALRPLIPADLAKVRMYCQVSPPGYDWFRVPGIGFVVYRTGNL